MRWMRSEATEDNFTLCHRAFQRKAALETNVEAIVIWLAIGRGLMKWENPPLGLFAIPICIGLISSIIGFKLDQKIEYTDQFIENFAPLFISWIILVFLASILMFTIPTEWGDPKEMRFGVLAGTFVVFLPNICGIGLLICAIWALPVVLGWVFVSTYQWKYDVQPFRTGLWLGVGGLTGMYMGAWAMWTILSA